MQDDSKHIAEADQATRNLVHTTSDMNVDTHLSDKEVSTDALVKNEAVKEQLTDTKTKAIERIKMGSNKICIRQDQAKEKMVFSQESRQAIFEMGSVELIELKTSMVQCPSCSHNVLKGTILCRCGKHIRPDLDMMRRIKAAFEVLKAPCFRTSSIEARRYKHGPNLWEEHHHKTKDALRGCSKNKRHYTSIWDRWQNGETYRESQLVINWSDAKIDISHTAPHLQRNRYKNLLYLRSVDEDKHAPLPPQRPGYQDAKKALVDMHKQVRQDCGVSFIPKVERQRLRNQLDASM